MQRSAPALLMAVVTAVVFGSPVSAQQRMTPELLWKLGRVSDVQVQPGGARLLYTVRRYELAQNRGESQVFELDLATGQHRQLTTVGSNFEARWSPRGDRIAFLSTRDGAPQIHVLALDGGEARRITGVTGGVANLAWSPDGAWFSFTTDVQLDPTVHDLYPDLPMADARIYDDLMVRQWDRWVDGSYSHLFVVPSDGSAEPRDLMAGMRADTPLKPFGGGEQIAWAPDSKSIVYTCKRVESPETSTDSDLFEVRLDAPEHRSLTDGMPGYDTNPSFSADGRHLAWLSMARDGYESDQNRLFVLDRQSGSRRRVDAWDGTIDEFAWLPGDAGFLLGADWRGAHQIFALPLAGGEPRQVTGGRWHFSGLAPAAGGDSVFATRMRMERPAEVVRVALGTDEPQQGVALTDVNGPIYEQLVQPAVEERWFDATDGERIHAWVVKPPDFDPSRRYPMITYCQGGPQSQVGQSFSFRWNFHLMAANGYVVLGVNRRGLPGFGTRWNEAISGDWGGQPMQDILSATDAMFEEPWIDREHTAAVGASFGGYTIYWLMGHDQRDRFCAMIAHCGVFNLESMYLATEELFFPNWDIGGPYWRDPAIQRDYDRFSPHRFVQHWDTPLLVIHGQRDFRVPVEQGLQAFTAAQLQGVPSRFLYFPAESHWVLSPQNGVLWHRVFFDWLDRYCESR
ncbi:MAG: S9 family peptidase [Planctomycetes bacterium]|nr:S9 family peptidase [Planctomycetota bacterium]